MELTEQEAHCLARLLQGSLYSSDTFIGCRFCKFPCDQNGSKPMFETVKKKLTDETEVDVSGNLYGYLTEGLTLHSMKAEDFPYKKFLQGSSETVKEHYRNFFSDI